MLISDISRVKKIFLKATTFDFCFGWPLGNTTFSMLNSAEHEILNAHNYKKYQEIQLFVGEDKPRKLFFPLINVEMPTVVGILTFMSRKHFMLSCVEHVKSIITSGPDLE